MLLCPHKQTHTHIHTVTNTYIAFETLRLINFPCYVGLLPSSPCCCMASPLLELNSEIWCAYTGCLNLSGIVHHFVVLLAYFTGVSDARLWVCLVLAYQIASEPPGPLHSAHLQPPAIGLMHFVQTDALLSKTGSLGGRAAWAEAAPDVALPPTSRD